jgi:L,D-peptidoglycan transpeptidase YkuD (ErfK/YbiS/YcfS/YnhG family)
MRCALGRSGVSWRKKEGDGASPAGVWKPLEAYYRPDRFRRLATRLRLQHLSPRDGWCDAPADRNYNRKVRHPYPASAERMWRADELYDYVVVLDHNQRPRVRARGSAIFLHVARPGYPPTEGCIAVAKADMMKLLPRLAPRTRVRLGR